MQIKRGLATMLALLFYDYEATMLPNMEGIVKNKKCLFKPKNELRLRGEYQATMRNNFQFGYEATMAGATMKRLLMRIERLWSDYDRQVDYNRVVGAKTM